jgi:hypothetical protein
VNSVNVNIPIVNLPQVGSQQSEAHRAPIVHQVQNADMARDRLELQARTAHEAEEAEGKTVDPDDHKEEQRGSKKRKGQQEDGGEEGEGRPSDITVTMSDSGRLIDLEA